MRFFFRWAAGIALLVVALDELLKVFVRVHLTPCAGTQLVTCDRLEVIGPVWLVRTGNAGSALGFGQGWWARLLLAVVGLVLIPLYARWLRGGGSLAVTAVGLQVGGALGNLLDRLVLGGATDVGWGPVWNLVDVAIGVGTLLATWALARRSTRTTAPSSTTLARPSPSAAPPAPP